MDYDFSFFLVMATLVTGAIWGAYALYIRVSADGTTSAEAPREPILVEYARSFFPIVLIVLLLRSFLVEPFRIPSGSMIPTLLVGDFILVNKFVYGVRLPVLNDKIIEMGEPERGDIVVFRFPNDPSIDYIKRVIGLPGDRISYFNKQLTVNGKPVPQVSLGSYSESGGGRRPQTHLVEELPDAEHSILVTAGKPGREGNYVVPEGHYFVMGDNRDNSFDSRYWGMVPEEMLVGKAFMIWMNLNWDAKSMGLNRLGTILK